MLRQRDSGCHSWIGLEPEAQANSGGEDAKSLVRVIEETRTPSMPIWAINTLARVRADGALLWLGTRRRD